MADDPQDLCRFGRHLQNNIFPQKFLPQIFSENNLKIKKVIILSYLIDVGGSGVAIPMPRSYTKIKNEITKGIKRGEYLLGIAIEPKSFTKHIIDQSGEVKALEIKVCGRKIPLNQIRKRLLDTHQKLGIMRHLPSITRHLVFWADHSSILNNGYLLFTVRLVYNKEYSYTDEEMYEQKGIKYDVQEIVESPQLYILGQSDDTLADELTYTETRVEDIINIQPMTTTNNCIVNDEVRFFIGENYLRQF